MQKGRRTDTYIFADTNLSIFYPTLNRHEDRVLLYDEGLLHVPGLLLLLCLVVVDLVQVGHMHGAALTVLITECIPGKLEVSLTVELLCLVTWVIVSADGPDNSNLQQKLLVTRMTRKMLLKMMTMWLVPVIISTTSRLNSCSIHSYIVYILGLDDKILQRNKSRWRIKNNNNNNNNT